MRLLYSPSYRFLTEEQQDRIDEADEGDVTLKVSRIFPIATGIEGEFAFNNLLSLAVGGSFSYQGDIMTWEINDRKINQSEVEMEVDYYEFTVNSSMYANVNRVKLGPGLGLTFANVTMDASLIDDNKKWELSSKFSYKRLSAHFSLRRDFFSTQSIGVGVGLTASMYLTDMFSRRVEQKSCEDGNDCETKTEDDDDFDDDESQGFYSVMLIPMIYLAS